MASYYPFGIFKLFFCVAKIKYVMYNVADYNVLCNNAVRYVIGKGCLRHTASNINTELALSSDSLDAITDPAEPAPTETEGTRMIYFLYHCQDFYRT
jgi:hypothetical protein